ELVLHYQPMVELETSCVVGAEALIRWQHPEEGLLAPARFLAVAERTGLIRPMTDWVLEQACVQVRRWCDQDLDLFVSVNLTRAIGTPVSWSKQWSPSVRSSASSAWPRGSKPKRSCDSCRTWAARWDRATCSAVPSLPATSRDSSEATSKPPEPSRLPGWR